MHRAINSPCAAREPDLIRRSRSRSTELSFRCSCATPISRSFFPSVSVRAKVKLIRRIIDPLQYCQHRLHEARKCEYERPALSPAVSCRLNLIEMEANKVAIIFDSILKIISHVRFLIDMISHYNKTLVFHLLLTSTSSLNFYSSLIKVYRTFVIYIYHIFYFLYKMLSRCRIIASKFPR